jgi:hypothetical protein
LELAVFAAVVAAPAALSAASAFVFAFLAAVSAAVALSVAFLAAVLAASVAVLAFFVAVFAASVAVSAAVGRRSSVVGLIRCGFQKLQTHFDALIQGVYPYGI